MVSIEVLTLLINVGLGAVCVALVSIFGESIFSDIAKFLFILAVSLMMQSAVSVFFSGVYADFASGVFVLIASICYLLVVSAVFGALRNMIASAGGE